MTQEFYEQLGVDRKASLARIRQAYGQAVAKLSKRRRALIEQGGDTAQLDLQRARVDEAWEVLSDPVRRRRYDAMLAWSEAPREPSADVLWKEVSGALVHPAAAVAAKLLRVTARLPEIGQLPLAPSGAGDEPPTLVPHDDDRTQPRIAPARLGSGTQADTEVTASSPRLAMPRPELRRETPAPSRGGELVDLPSAADEREGPGLRVVDGTPSASKVIVMQGADDEGLSAEEVGRLLDAHGFSGALLRAVRQARQIALQDMSDHTRISVKYLEAIELEAFDALPSPTFVRGYVREMARMLRLPDDDCVAGYMRRMSG